jgi:hypothetical protein
MRELFLVFAFCIVVTLAEVAETAPPKAAGITILIPRPYAVVYTGPDCKLKSAR